MKTTLFTSATLVDLAATDFSSRALATSLSACYTQLRYTVMFEQYRVLKATYHFHPRNTVYQTSSDGTNPALMAAAPDFDDQTAVTNTIAGFDELLIKPGCVVRSISGPEFRMSFEPRLEMDAPTGAGAVGMAVVPSSKVWLSTSNATAIMRGMKILFMQWHEAWVHNYIGVEYWSLDIEFRGQHSGIPGVSVTTPNPAASVQAEPDDLGSQYIKIDLLRSMMKRSG